MREMRKNKASSNPSRPKWRILLLGLGVYLLGLLLGSAFIIGVPCLHNRESLLGLAADETESLLDIFAPAGGPTYGTEFYLIAEDGNIIYSNQEFLYPGEKDRLLGFAKDALTHDPLYQVHILRMGETAPGKPTLCLVAGVVRESRGGRLFSGILLRDLRDLDVTLESFAGIYTLIFLTAAWLIAYIAHEQRELNQMRRDLVANVSHELKTPITSIKAIAEILHDGMADSPQEIHRYSASILTETDNLEEMVMEILDLSRLQSHRMDLKKSKIYPDGLFLPLIDRYMMLCTDLGVHFACSPDSDAIPPLLTDPENMTKVLSILLDNAIKFTGKGGHVSLLFKPGKGFLTVSVKDDGPGIRAEDLDHIFDRFYKADTARNSKGSGLGLAIAHEIVKTLEEKLWVESTYGQGSEFFCTIHYK